MKTCISYTAVLFALLLAVRGDASETRIIINLSDQRVSLVEQGKVTLVSPIASGKAGWLTPTGTFRIFNKDIDHQSRSFGLVVDAYGRVVNSNATPCSHTPKGCHYQPAPMPYFMEFSPAVGMHAGYLPGYPASHGCVRMPADLAALFFERVHIGTPVAVVGSTNELALSVGLFRYCLHVHLRWVSAEESTVTDLRKSALVYGCNFWALWALGPCTKVQLRTVASRLGLRQHRDCDSHKREGSITRGLMGAGVMRFRLWHGGICGARSAAENCK